MIKFDIKGFDKVALEIESLSDDKMKRREILKILRRQMQPVLDKMKQNAPNQRTKEINRGELLSDPRIEKQRLAQEPRLIQPGTSCHSLTPRPLPPDEARSGNFPAVNGPALQTGL